MPKIHGMPWPVSAKSLTMERTLPHDDLLCAHTPSRLDMQISMARREFIAISLNEGFRCMQSSSGNPSFPYCSRAPRSARLRPAGFDFACVLCGRPSRARAASFSATALQRPDLET